MIAVPGAWFKRVILTVIINHGFVLGVTFKNHSEPHFPFPLKARCTCTLVDCCNNGGFAR